MPPCVLKEALALGRRPALAYCPLPTAHSHASLDFASALTLALALCEINSRLKAPTLCASLKLRENPGGAEQASQTAPGCSIVPLGGGGRLTFSCRPSAGPLWDFWVACLLPSIPADAPSEIQAAAVSRTSEIPPKHLSSRGSCLPSENTHLCKVHFQRDFLASKPFLSPR